MSSQEEVDMDIEITDTIEDMNEEEWNTFVGPQYIERTHAWYRTVEDSSARRMHYIFLRENGRLAAAACSYEYSERLHNLEIPFLEVKSPLGFSKAFFSRSPLHTGILVRELEQIRKKEKGKGLLIFDLNRYELNAYKPHVKGFAAVYGSDNTYIDLPFSDFDEYLTSLEEKAWRSARMTLNRARRWKIKTVFTNDFSTWRDVALKLQEHLCSYHNDYRMYLPERFYDALEKNLKDRAELILFFKDDIPLVSALSLYTPDVSLYKAAGIDIRYRKYQAYFLLYYEAIRRALEKNQKRIYFGPTTYEFKEKIGCKREELFGLIKMGNPLLNMILRSYLIGSQFLGKRF